MTRTTDFASYVKALCLDLAEIRGPSDSGIKLICESESLILDLDVVTALGLIIAELVTNSYDHAFPGGHGSTDVTVRRSADDTDTAIITIRDSGIGFKAGIEGKRHGIGLVRRLVEQVRGTLIIESNHGTVCTIKFPLPGAALVKAA